jgi:hypothetical protein
MLSGAMTFKTVNFFDENEFDIMQELGYGITLPEEWVFLKDV